MWLIMSKEFICDGEPVPKQFYFLGFNINRSCIAIL
jgi:hypothetical protein